MVGARGADRRREIVAAMLGMAGEEGIDRVTTRALARRLGVTEPALYRHFPGGKAEMWRTLAETVGERMQSAWQAALADQSQPARERLRALLLAQMRTVVQTPALPSILFSRTLHRDNAELRAGMAEIANRFHAHVEQLVVVGRETGELRSDLEPAAAAWLLISAIQGTGIRWSVAEQAFDLETEGLRVVDVALAGMVADRT